MDELYLIAEIKSSNKDGFVSIKSYSDFPERFLCLDKAVIELYGTLRPIIISDAVVNGNSVFLKFENFESAEYSDALLNCKLYINSSEKIDLPDNYYFIHDLIGCKIFKGDEFIGILIDVLTLPANDAYIVNSTLGKEIIVPATRDAVKLVDIENRKVYLNDNYELINDVEDWYYFGSS